MEAIYRYVLKLRIEDNQMYQKINISIYSLEQ